MSHMATEKRILPHTRALSQTNYTESHNFVLAPLTL